MQNLNKSAIIIETVINHAVNKRPCRLQLAVNTVIHPDLFHKHIYTKESALNHFIIEMLPFFF